jgi:hypothetical protein
VVVCVLSGVDVADFLLYKHDWTLSIVQVFQIQWSGKWICFCHKKGWMGKVPN